MSLIVQENITSYTDQIDIQQLADIAYTSVTDRNGFNPFLHALQNAFNCQTATLSIRDMKTGQVMGGWYQDMPQDVIEWYIANLGHRDPLLKRAIEQESVGFCSAFYSNDNHLSDPIVQAWCNEAGIADGACALIHKDTDSMFALTLGRSADQGQFQPQELQLLNTLIRDIRRAIALRLAVDQSQDSSLVKSIFDHINLPLVFIKQGGYVSFQNQQAEKWQQQSALISINTSGTIELHDHPSNAKLLANSSALLDKNETDSKVISIKNNDEGVSLLLTPIRNEQPHEQGVLLTIYPWNSQHGVSPERIKEFFGLTKTEAQVCDYLCQGYSLESIADITCRGVATVRSHLKSIYIKTATNRQAELVSHVLTTLMRNEHLR